MNPRALFDTQILIFLFFIVNVWTTLSYAVTLPQTGQKKCYNSEGAEVVCAGTGQDGEKRFGTSWPKPRFKDNENGTVTDNLTGLIWLKDANCTDTAGGINKSDGLTWTNALIWANNVTSGLCNLSDGSQSGDWRLPNILELDSLVHAGYTEEMCEASLCLSNDAWLKSQGFTYAPYYIYWSSSNYSHFPDSAWGINLSTGQIFNDRKFYMGNVWPVRGGQFTAPAEVWKTGQILCYDSDGNGIDCAGTGQDGEKQYGASWPNPRFKDNENGTVTDNLTGLIWLKDTNCTDTAGSINKSDGSVTWTNALIWANNLTSGICNLGDSSQSGDWRLPTKKEILSLMDFSRYDTDLPSNNYFTNSQYVSSWSSSTFALASRKDNAWYSGKIYAHKSYIGLVMPVRSGQSELFGDSGILPSPTTNDFGSVNSGSSSSVQSFTITNTGTNNLFINQIIFSGANSDQFNKQNDTCSNKMIAPSDTCTVEVIFSPLSTGAKSTSLIIPSNAPSTPLVIVLSGTGVQYALNVNKTGTGDGTVSATNINCGLSCSAMYNLGASLILNAVASDGSTFTGWSNGSGSAFNCSGTGQCLFNITVASSVTATFVLAPLNGVCGSSDGQTMIVAPSANLCSVGTAGPVSGSGPWAWTCSSVNAGTIANCSAKIQAFTITPTAGSGGAIFPSGATAVNYGGEQVFKITPDSGYHIADVKVDGISIGTLAEYKFSNVVSLHVIEAIFAADSANRQYLLTVVSSGKGSGSISSSDALINCGADSSTSCSKLYFEGSVVILKATPQSGSTFSNWMNCPVADGDTCSVTMSGSKAILAVFGVETPSQYALTVGIKGSGLGNVIATGIDCGLDCTEVYTAGASVTLTAVADSGYAFAGWAGGECSGTDTCTVAMNSDTVVTAAFIQVASEGNFSLTVIMAGAGTGTVTTSAGELECDDNICSATYISGKSLTIAAEAEQETSLFSGWDGCDSVKSGKCTVKMTEDKIVTATFIEFPKLTIIVNTAESKYGIGTGTVISAGISCGNVEDIEDSDCDQTYNKTSKVILKAIADKGSVFVGWEGCDTAKNNTCTITIDEDKEVIATFEPTPRYAVTVTKAGNGSGKVTTVLKGIDDTGIHCDAGNTDCASDYSRGTTMTLTAKADSGSKFIGWSGYPACEGKTTATCKISKLSGNADITATFGSPEMSLSVDTLDFGNVDKNDMSSQTFTISNNGYGNLTAAFKFGGTGAKMFKVYNSLGKLVSKATVAAGTSPGFEVRFKPTSVGEKTATLTVSSNDPNKLKIDLQLGGTCK